ncbi:MAG: hypothetical protein ABSF64_18565 [Bryobacteraceae bacterium]|jgi:hypothetical protein
MRAGAGFGTQFLGGNSPYNSYEGIKVPIGAPEEILLDWSDSWSDADLREFTAASLKRFQDEEQEEPR